MFLLNGVTLDFSIESFCAESASLLQVVGWIVTIFKIAIPILIIILGLFDFGKAVVASKDDEIKKQSKTLMYRILAGFIIFFIPSIVLWLFSTINDYNSVKGSFQRCEDCILRPWNAASCIQ